MNKRRVGNASASVALEPPWPNGEPDVPEAALPPVLAESAPESAQETASKPLPRVVFRPTLYTEALKPAIDRVIALVALFALFLPMLAIAAVIVLSMGHPILFRQRRIGRSGIPFEMLKFRTMGPDRRVGMLAVIRDRRRTHKSDRDPRHTRIGRFLRRYSLDELPQLINIVRGDMSVVGPRPELESVVADHYPPGLEQRHQVRPGLTGPWQISARGDGPMHLNGARDLEYVERISFGTDLLILLRTPMALFGMNAGR